jgi:hypothetical protein
MLIAENRDLLLAIIHDVLHCAGLTCTSSMLLGESNIPATAIVGREQLCSRFQCETLKPSEPVLQSLIQRSKCPASCLQGDNSIASPSTLKVARSSGGYPEKDPPLAMCGDIISLPSGRIRAFTGFHESSPSWGTTATSDLAEHTQQAGHCIASDGAASYQAHLGTGFVQPGAQETVRPPLAPAFASVSLLIHGSESALHQICDLPEHACAIGAEYAQSCLVNLE